MKSAIKTGKIQGLQMLFCVFMWIKIPVRRQGKVIYGVEMLFNCGLNVDNFCEVGTVLQSRAAQAEIWRRSQAFALRKLRGR